MKNRVNQDGEIEMLVIPEKTDDRSSSAQFMDAIEVLKKSIEEEKQLCFLTEKAMDEMLAASRNARELSNQLLTCDYQDGVLSIKAHNRTLTLLKTLGFGRDSRLAEPRCMLCSLFLIFTHCSGEKEATLYSSFRVYPDGACTDGRMHWNVNHGQTAFEPFVFSLITQTLLRTELLWTSMDDLPERLTRVRVDDGKIDAGALVQSSIGFESSFIPSS